MAEGLTNDVKFSTQVWPKNPATPEEVEAMTGFVIKHDPNTGKYRITHPYTSTELQFDLQWSAEAEEMRWLLARAIVRQNTCVKKKKLFDTCKMHSDVSWGDADLADLSVDDNRFFVWPDSMVHTAETIMAVIGWKKSQHPMRGGVLYFVDKISDFLNAIQNKQNTIKKPLPIQYIAAN